MSRANSPAVAEKRRRLEDPHLEESDDEDLHDDPAGLVEEEADEPLDHEDDDEVAPREPSPPPVVLRAEAATDEEFDRYCSVLHEHPHHVRQFNVLGYQTVFSIKRMEDLNGHEQCEMFLRIIQRFIDTALEKADENGFETHQIGIAFMADGMKHGEYLISFKSPEENNAHKLMEAIYNFQQSASDIEVIGNTCQLKVTVCRRPVGRGKAPRLNMQGTNINPKSRLEVAEDAEQRDNICLFKAIVVAKNYVDEKEEGANRVRPNGETDTNWCKRAARFRQNPRRVLAAARDLMAQIGLGDADIYDPRQTYGLPELQRVQDLLQREEPGKYQILAFTASAGTKPVFNPKLNAPLEICIYHEDAHWIPAKAANLLLGSTYYCAACETTLEKLDTHTARCTIKCLNCLRMGPGYPCQGDEHIECPKCRKWFVSQDCFNEHKLHACNVFKRCLRCDKIWRPAKPDDKHECDIPQCRKCWKRHARNERCFVQKPRIWKRKHYRIVAFDYECKIWKKAENDERKTLHEPNYLAARVTCTRCIRNRRWNRPRGQIDCEICGPRRHFCIGEWETEDGNVTAPFVDWLMTGLPLGFTTYAYSHNGAKYDSHFIMQEFWRRGGVKPEILSNGNKLFQVSVKRTKHTNHVVLRDSNLLFPMKLSGLKDAFELKCEQKPWFPYRANHDDFYDCVRDHLPAKNYYCPESMTEKEYAKFEEWHNANSATTTFNLKRDLKDYCLNDATILLHALVKFRSIFNRLSRFDNFAQSCTITGACLRLYKHRYMKKDTVAIIPPYGYGPHERQSAKAMKYLKWFAAAHRVNVKHRDNGGEEKVGRYKVDGFIEAAERQSPRFRECGVPGCAYCEQKPIHDCVIEFNGCFYHGCPYCLKNDAAGVGGRPTEELWQHTMQREEDLLAQGLFVMRMQECKFDEHFKKDKKMKRFFEMDCFDTGPIRPRDAFFGGRVHPTCLRYKPKPGEEIKYVDVCSLYPFVLCKPYPVGHPRIIRYPEELGGSENWDTPYDYRWKGLIKCVVVPPRDLEIPVLPVRDAGRLCFPTCRTCMVESRNASAYNAHPTCNHNRRERAFVTTATHMELDLALMMGYKVRGVIEVWHWEQWEEDMFAEYIREFYKIKEEASGWKGCNTDAEKKAHIRKVYEKTGVLLEPKNMEKKNEGMRYVAKLCLNSLWGRFAMRIDRSQVEVVTKPSRLNELLDDPSVTVQAIVKLNEETIKVSYKYRDHFEKTDQNSNLAIAIFTTAYGRVELYRHFRHVHEPLGGAIGARKLYADTDSVIFKQLKSNPALRAGKALGEMEDEHPDKTILEYMSGGCKQYGLKLQDDKGNISYVLKNRGISQKSKTKDFFNFDVLKAMIAEDDACQPVGVPTTDFRVDKHNNVMTVDFEKRYQPRFNKGWIDTTSRTRRIVPHGFLRSPPPTPTVSRPESPCEIEWQPPPPVATTSDLRRRADSPARNPRFDPLWLEWKPEDRVLNVDQVGSISTWKHYAYRRRTLDLDQWGQRALRRLVNHRWWLDGFESDDNNSTRESSPCGRPQRAPSTGTASCASFGSASPEEPGEDNREGTPTMDVDVASNFDTIASFSSGEESDEEIEAGIDIAALGHAARPH